MSNMSNPLQESITRLFERLSILNGLLHHLEHQLRNQEKLIRESYKKHNLDIEMLFGGARLAIMDISIPLSDGYVKWNLLKAFSARGEEFLNTSRDIVARESLRALSQAYEAFETFLYDMLGLYFDIHNNKVDTNKLNTYKTKKNITHELNGFQDWRAFAKFAYQQNNDAIKYIRKISPDISDVEKKNSRKVNVNEWFSVITEIRHSVTHSEMRLSKSKFNSWSKSKKEILGKIVVYEEESDGYKMRTTRKNAEYNMELLAEYAFILFKYLSISINEGYDWDIFEHK
jgi:hypothetical protein